MLCTTFVALGVACGPNRSNKFSLMLFCCVPLCGLRGGVLGLSQNDVRPSTAIYAARLRTLPHAPRAARRRCVSAARLCSYPLIAAHRRTSPHIAAHCRTSQCRRTLHRRDTSLHVESLCMSPHVAACRLPPLPHVAAWRHMLLHDAA